mgnify:CR=1 FL=1
MTRTAAALVIGNEILSGKIVDTNTTFLARGLFELGIELRRVVVCPDEIETISRDLSELRGSHDWVFTSGGVGPTHDDVTIEGVAVTDTTDTPGIDFACGDRRRERCEETHRESAHYNYAWIVTDHHHEDLIRIILFYFIV